MFRLEFLGVLAVGVAGCFLDVDGGAGWCCGWHRVMLLRLAVLISWYRAVGVSRRGFCHRSLVRWRKMRSPRPRLEAGGLVFPEASAMGPDLRPSYFPGCARRTACASQRRLLTWSDRLWPGSGHSRSCLPAWPLGSVCVGVAAGIPSVPGSGFWLGRIPSALRASF